MGRLAAGLVIALGATLVASGAVLGWLSWMEPHSRGIHPADRGPVVALVVVGLMIAGLGAAALVRPPRG